MIKHKISLVLLICLFSIAGYSQNSGLNKIDYQKSLSAHLELVKTLESQMKLIPQSTFSTLDKTHRAGDFYMSIYETTNEAYNAFLKDLENYKLNDLVSEFKIDNSQWKKLSEAYETASKFYDTDTKYSQYPVVNITKEGAEAFCIWLTRLYAVYDQAKYPGAEFRLPTESEWLVAAAGGSKNAIYPWDGKFLTDKKGEYRANFRVAGEENIRLNPETGNVEILDDNVVYSTTLQPTKCHEPNNYGLYQMAGNAAELTVDGNVKGGSWHSFGHYMQIGAEQELNIGNLPNPFTGFRLVLITK
ncbi:MAG: SUMF1/EgtB/PvdO family nonheme iron enzyme [Bacteroidales bacterium]|jgi:formylglycine-generating enzyme required for sulfatase activity|nr:SUMF1/EgtB/PvdO family nonheme iron enzyme [Bacteroidales bacterium]